jgi:hypothetical protein
MGGCAEVTTPQDIAPVTITVATYPGLGTPLENVQVCEIDTGTCVMSNADGEATLQIVVGKETSVTLDKEGYGSYLIPLLVPPDGLTFSSGISNDVRLATQHENVMSRYPPKDTGTILLHLRVRSFAGATFDLLEASAKAFYDDEEGWWDPDLTATTSSPLGGGGFVEVSSGVYHVGFGGTAERCAPEDYRGWPGRFENSVRFPVREGYLSHVDVICDEVEAP